MSESLHLFIIGTMATMIAGAYGWGWLLHTSICKRYEKDMASHAKAGGVEMQRMHQDFYEYKLHVANSFASLTHLQESERRTQHSLEGINAKLDRLIEGRMK